MLTVPHPKYGNPHESLVESLATVATNYFAIKIWTLGHVCVMSSTAGMVTYNNSKRLVFSPLILTFQGQWQEKYISHCIQQCRFRWTPDLSQSKGSDYWLRNTPKESP